MFAVILTVPRVAALRPSAAPAIIKGIIKSKGLESQVLDINLDFHDQFGGRYSEQSYNTIDDYFFNHLKQLNQQDQTAYTEWMQGWADQIKQINPKYLFISVFTWQAQRFTRDFLTLWKTQSKIPVIIGGQGMTKEENGSYSNKPEFAHEMKDQGLIAHWIRGEAETTIPAIIDGKFDTPGIDTDTLADRSDVNSHSFLDFSDFDIKRYHSGYEQGVLPVETSRGCVRNCVFCDIPTWHGKFRYKNGTRLSSELIHYYEKYQVKDFFFHDALCNGSVKDFKLFNRNLIDYYTQNNLSNRYFKYSSHYIVRSERIMPEEDFKFMGSAGAECMVIGVESGSDRVKADMRKGFNNADLDYNMKMFSKYGITVYLLLIVGFPTETRKDFDETLTMLKRYQPYVADGTVIGVNLGTTLTIEEGSPIYTDYAKLNIVGTNGNRPQGPDWYCKTNPTLTYKERIMRRIEAQEYATSLGYTFWKGDDQLKLLMDNYTTRLNRLAGVIH
jgi:hypothetical protein|tara:strand:- start:5194 stop:6693 length:1500 start_codon:yes stop_codon:yes gene_type:complete